MRICGEGMILGFDANVHVGQAIGKKCNDKQDWGGKKLLELIKDENLTLVNAEETCSGVVTRIDPRNGKGSSIDLVVVNQYMKDKLVNMEIDEKGIYKLANYDAKSKKVTDHNTIIVKTKVKKGERRKQPSYLNTKSEVGREKFCKVINGKHQILSNLFADSDTDISTEFQKMTDTWDTIIRESFDEIKPNKQTLNGPTKNKRR